MDAKASSLFLNGFNNRLWVSIINYDIVSDLKSNVRNQKSLWDIIALLLFPF